MSLEYFDAFAVAWVVTVGATEENPGVGELDHSRARSNVAGGLIGEVLGDDLAVTLRDRLGAPGSADPDEAQSARGRQLGIDGVQRNLFGALVTLGGDGFDASR